MLYGATGYLPRRGRKLGSEPGIYLLDSVSSLPQDGRPAGASSQVAMPHRTVVRADHHPELPSLIR
jgi:hypothetical protein